MEIVLFTKNGSLNNLWRSYSLGKNVKFAHNKKDFLNVLRDYKVEIAGIDFDTIKDDIKGNLDELSLKFPNTKIFILANEPNFIQGKYMLALGIKGYANSHMQEIHFKDAFKAIGDGSVWLYPEFVQEMIVELTNSYENINSTKNDSLDVLTSREKEVADLVYKGLTNQEISDNIDATLRTVKAHITSIYSKLGVKDRIGLVLFMQKLANA
ncbi:response regulator transcription factor [Campylobacter sp. faydin G-24]|uniref:Response regulator transcription factor n=1 Tax=Campylobacter anatolicus TaxID=2829105 RepID=A0ABS5HJY2_9BACT|nr:response regulator transcription factor [Campylobacter anatolicus]MBR8464575.1 response regulator transcription factor [Campylobacter anatolicus]